MDLRKTIAGRIIDRVQEFIPPLGEEGYDKMESIIIDELSGDRRILGSRGGSFNVNDYDQDVVRHFLDLYPGFREFIEGKVLPAIQERWPGVTVDLCVSNDPESGMGITYERRSLHVDVYLSDEDYNKELEDYDFLNSWGESHPDEHEKFQTIYWIDSQNRNWGSSHLEEKTRLQVALHWMNVTTGWLRHTVQLDEDLAKRIMSDPPALTEQETIDLCTLLGINYEWVASPEPIPISAYQEWDKMRTRKGE